jgi:CHASE1-domain containing sensor protein
VLAALPRQFPQVRLRLQDAADASPFFELHARAAHEAAEGAPATRGFSVYGRNWSLQVEATEALRRSTQVVAPLAVLGAGALLTLLLSLIAWLIDARRAGAGLAVQNRGGVLAFVNSALGRWAALCLLLVASV